MLTEVISCSPAVAIVEELWAKEATKNRLWVLGRPTTEFEVASAEA